MHRRLRSAAAWLLALCLLVMSSVASAAPTGPWSEPDAACPVSCPCDFEADVEHTPETLGLAARTSFQAPPTSDDCDDCIEGCTACSCRAPNVVALLPSPTGPDVEVSCAHTLLREAETPPFGTEVGVFRPPRSRR